MSEQTEPRKDNWDINPGWLLPLLALACFQPQNDAAFSAANGNKSVNLHFDPHDPESVKAAETWVNALFRDKSAPTFAPAVKAVRGGDTVKFAEPDTKQNKRGATFQNNELLKTLGDAGIYLRKVEHPEPGKTYFKADFDCLTPCLTPVIFLNGHSSGCVFHDCLTGARCCGKVDLLEFAAPSESVFDEALKQFQREGFCCPFCPEDDLRAAAEPLREYLRKYGDPHTSVTVTQDGATVKQDERYAKFNA